MGLFSSFLSNDVDVITDPEFTSLFAKARLLKGQRSYYLEPCDAGTFTVAPDWTGRAYTHQESNVTVLFPHPIDILTSKINGWKKRTLELSN